MTLSRKLLSGSLALAAFSFVSMVQVGCSSESGEAESASNTGNSTKNESNTLARLRGKITIDGSSTVYPISEAVVESFAEAAPNVDITIGFSGTGGGFKKFNVGETQVSNASRPIKQSEAANASENGINFIELPVAYDGLSIVVNKDNDWVDALTIDDLKKIYLDGQNTTTWKDVRPEWPATPLKIYSPGTDSGTFDYFKETVAGKTGVIRSQLSVSEDDNVLVRGVAGDIGAIGFFGCAYAFENADTLRICPIINPANNTAVSPTPVTIENGTYSPFSRPLFIYVNAEKAGQREIKAFIEFYLENAPEMAAKVGYVGLPSAIYGKAMENFKAAKTGTHFLTEDGEKKHGSLVELYQ